MEIHFSHIDSNHLFLIRLGCFIYLTTIYIWTLNDMGSFLTNIIYLTMQGYLITWLYFSLVIQDYLFHNKFGKKIIVSEKYVLIKLDWNTIFRSFMRQHCAMKLWLLLFFGVFYSKFYSNLTYQVKLLLLLASDVIMQSNLHAGPIVCLTLDLIYNNFAFHIRHLCVLITFGTVYMIINLSILWFKCSILTLSACYLQANWLGEPVVLYSYFSKCWAGSFISFYRKDNSPQNKSTKNGRENNGWACERRLSNNER